MMGDISKYTRLITTFTIILALVGYTFQATIPANKGSDNPFGKECIKNSDCSCTSNGIPMCYGGYCHCVYSANLVCGDNPCGQHCPSGIGICFLNTCHCYKLVEDQEATDKIPGNPKPELIKPEEETDVPESEKHNLVPTLLK